MKRAANYKNMFDKSTGFMRGKNYTGNGKPSNPGM